MTSRALDIICLGRSSVDLYGEQSGCRLEDTSSFAKYVGGCATNIAVGTARLGLRSSLITRVGDEQLGRFIIETLAAEGVDTSHITVDPRRLTALVILGLRDNQTFPHIFYRPDPADMAISVEHIEASHIASAHALLLTGTHFSQAGVAAASCRAAELAQAAGTQIILDIDYRPVLWGLAGHAEGDSRFVHSAPVTETLRAQLPLCDVIVGTEEEIHIAGGSTDTLAALRAIRAASDALIVLKRGPQGCAAFETAIPESLDAGLTVEGTPVEVFNTLGAGDGFMSGFLRGWLRDEALDSCLRYANAAGALVVSRHGCAPAIPSWDEIDYVLKGKASFPKLHADAELARLHRVTTRRRKWPEILALAFDHRQQLIELATANGADPQRIVRFKNLVAEGAACGSESESGKGMIVDGRFGGAVLARLSGGDWWLARPVEKPGVLPLEFEAGDSLAIELRTWPRDQIAKCLVYYHPDDPEDTKRVQLRRLDALYQACIASDRELLIEVIAPPNRPAHSSDMARALNQIYSTGIYPDWWKLPPADSAAEWDRIAAVVGEFDPYCRGIVILGLNAPEEELKRGFDIAASQSLCKGFAVGRSIFQQPAEAWFAGEIDDGELVRNIALRYRRIIDLWRNRNPDGLPARPQSSVSASTN